MVVAKIQTLRWICSRTIKYQIRNNDIQERFSVAPTKKIVCPTPFVMDLLYPMNAS
jgi:hypothetical protein